MAALLISCGGGPPPPREYPAIGSQGEESRGPTAREPLRGEPLEVLQRSGSALVTIRVAFDVGSADDPAGREGVTNLTARLLVEGGAGELTYRELTERLYPMAGRLSAHVGRDQTVFVGQVHRDHLDDFYELFRDVLLRPALSRTDFERVRQQVRTELTLDLLRSDDEALGKEVLQSMLYAGHPYGHPVLGSATGLSRLRVDDVRAHRRRVFCAGRATVGVAGDVDAAFARQLVSDISVLRGGSCEGRPQLAAPTIPDGRRVLIVDKPEARAVAVSMGLPYGVRRDHPDYPALVLVASWLGQHRQFVGRLMQAIRGQRGLNYGDYAYAEHFTQEGWSRLALMNDARRQQYFSIWLRPLRPETAHFAIRLAVRELERLVENGLDQDELDRIRTFATRNLSLSFQTESRRLGAAIDDGYYGMNEAHANRLRRDWAVLTPESMTAAIQRHLDPSRLQIAIVAADGADLAERLVADEPSPVTYRSAVGEEVLAEDEEIVSFGLGLDAEDVRVVPLEELF